MFVDQHEDWEAQGGEVSHVMGQICALVLDKNDRSKFLDSHHHLHERASSSGAIGPAAGLPAAVDAAVPLTGMEVPAPGLAAAVA